MEQEKIRRSFSRTIEVQLRTFRETPRITLPSVLRLVLDGTLHVDLWSP